MINWNGVLTNDKEIYLTLNNRAFKYGDGFFETMLMVSGEIKFSDDHWIRIKKSAEILNLTLPFENYSHFLSEISKITSGVDLNNFRIRLQCWRECDGFYLPNEKSCNYYIEINPILKNQSSNNNLKLGLYTKDKKNPSAYSFIKSTSALFYVLASIELKNTDFDDLIVFNTQDNPIETIQSNIFIIKNNVIKTPLLTEGCIDGVYRKNLIRVCKQCNIPLFESSVSLQMIMDADAVFLTNALKGIQIVERINDKVFLEHNQILKLKKLMS